MTPRRLEKYELLEELGHGGMATVYRARDTVLERLVALKVMHPHLRSSVEARRRFHREAKSVARLHHRCVMEIYDFSGEGSEEAFIAAELLTGPTLRVFRDRCPHMLAEVAACFVIEVASALQAAHEAGIIHRDVKPENVLLHEARTVKLTDFGIADMVDAQSVTVTGQILGSPGHMAPEQIEGRAADARTDLFSLGTVLYFLATGTLPFSGRNPHQVLKRIMDGDYPNPLRVAPGMGKPLRQIIDRALARRPEDRYQSAADLIRDLRTLLAEAGLDESPSALLERYLSDPAVAGQAYEDRVVEALVDRGRQASKKGEVTVALDAFDRALAIREGDPLVLQLLRRVGVTRRRRWLLRHGAAAAAMSALGGAAWWAWPSDREPRESTRVRPDPAAGRPTRASLRLDAGTPTETEARSGRPTSSRDQPGLAGGSKAAPPSRVDGGRGASSPARRVRPRSAAQRMPRPPRPVHFITYPTVCWIRIDDGPWHENTRDFRPLLRPGRHTVIAEARVQGTNPYLRTSRELVVPVDPEGTTHTIRFALKLADAGLRIASNAANGRVLVGEGLARGRTNTLIAVPMSEARRVGVLVVVSAEGFAPATVRVERLEAGTTREVRVDLRATGP